MFSLPPFPLYCSFHLKCLQTSQPYPWCMSFWPSSIRNQASCFQEIGSASGSSSPKSSPITDYGDRRVEITQVGLFGPLLVECCFSQLSLKKPLQSTDFLARNSRHLHIVRPIMANDGWKQGDIQYSVRLKSTEVLEMSSTFRLRVLVMRWLRCWQWGNILDFDHLKSPVKGMVEVPWPLLKDRIVEDVELYLTQKSSE